MFFRSCLGILIFLHGFTPVILRQKVTLASKSCFSTAKKRLFDIWKIRIRPRNLYNQTQLVESFNLVPISSKMELSEPILSSFCIWHNLALSDGQNPRKNECFRNLIYARLDGFHQNIMRGPMVFIFLYARLQFRQFLPLIRARDNSSGGVQASFKKRSVVVLESFRNRQESC